MQWSMLNTSLTPEDNSPIMLSNVPAPVATRGVASIPQQTQPAAPMQRQPAAPMQSQEPRSIGFSKDAAKAQYDARAEFMDRYKKYMDEKAAMINDTKARLATLEQTKNPSGPDFSGLAVVADMMGGNGLFSRNYKKPTDNMDREALRMKLEDRLMSQLGGQADDALNAVRNEDMVRNWANQADSRMAVQEARNQGLLEKAMLANQLGGAKAEKPLSEGLLQRKDYAIGIESAAAALEKIANDPSQNDTWSKMYSGMALNSSFLPDDPRAFHIRNLAENYGRMQSGGAIQQDEAKRFVMSLFKPTDTPQMVKAKIKYFQDLGYARRTAIDSGGRDTPPATPNYSEIAKQFGVKDAYIPKTAPAGTQASANYRSPADTSTSAPSMKNKTPDAMGAQAQLARIQEERRKRGL